MYKRVMASDMSIAERGTGVEVREVKRFMTPAEFAEELKVSYRKVMQMKQEGELPIRWISPRYYRIDVEAYYESLAREGYEAPQLQ